MMEQAVALDSDNSAAAHGDTASEPAGKLRVVIIGGISGLIAPLMSRIEREFEVVAVLKPAMPKFIEWAFRAISVRWPRNSWYRRWRYHMEKTPFSFRMRSRVLAGQLEQLAGRYDLLLVQGVMYSPGDRPGTPMFLFTDSCRWLSSRNPYDEVSHFRNRRDEIEWLALERAVYASARRIFIGNQMVKRALVEQYGVESARIVVAGFGPGVGFGEPYDKSFDGKSILYIGKGDFEKKGGMVLMEAFKLVRREIPDAVLHVVGQDRLPEAEGVVNHGFVRDRQKLVGLMRSAHVFSLPSLVDRNPLSVIEAMASATPCVVSNYGAIPEIVGDGGAVTPCNDAAAIAAALVGILRDRELAATMGRAGRARFERAYTWDGIWARMRQEILDCIRPRSEV